MSKGGGQRVNGVENLVQGSGQARNDCWRMRARADASRMRVCAGARRTAHGTGLYADAD